MVRLMAVGGGGVTHGTDPLLDEVLIGVLGKVRPRVGYIGYANDDDPTRLSRFVARFEALGADAVPLPATATAPEAVAWAVGLDALYVGGGQTARLLGHWRESGIDRVLADAGHDGVLLAGVSAGAVCWFESALWDGAGAGYRPLAGLGLVPGSCCPHFDTEPGRRPAFRDHVARGEMSDGVALDDGAALLIAGDGPPRGIAARPGATVWKVQRAGSAATILALDGVEARH